MATAEHLKKLMELCEKYELEGVRTVEKYTIEELARIYNGAGPDSWIPAARDVLTDLMELFEPVVLIHDVQFSESDALHETFERTVDVWKQNCKKIFDAEYPLWTWRQLSASYRRRRAYWYGVMQAGNLAISSHAAFKAWTAAHKIPAQSAEAEG